jgi:diguanylate cyclase (GGDEF)-like protein
VLSGEDWLAAQAARRTLTGFPAEAFMIIPRRYEACIALLLAAAAAGAQNARSPQGPLRTLTAAGDVHSLTTQEAARSYPVRLHAVVTYYDPYIDVRHGALFVHDATGSIFVSLPKTPVLPLRGGTDVEVVGVSGAGDYAPVVYSSQVRVVGQSSVPSNPIKATAAQLLSPNMDGQWVEVGGIVHAVHAEPKNVSLDIETTSGPVTATTRRNPGVNYESLLDCQVRIRANAAPQFNRKRQMVGAHLFFPSMAELTVESAAATDPFSMPIVPVSQLLNYSPGLQLAHRVHVQATVTLQWPGRMLCIQQQGGALCMMSEQALRAAPGELVDVVGFPSVVNYKPTLENATFRLAGHAGPPPQVIAVTPAQAFQGDHDTDLVRIEGELVGQDRATGDLTLMLRSGEYPFPAILPRELAGPSANRWKEGSILRLTGICSALIDSATTNLGEGGVRPGSVQILLRSAGDIEVMKTPSWWTPGHALGVLAAFALLVLAAIAWIVVLRRRVEQQTRALRASEERLRHLSEHDALTSLPNRILLSDRLAMALERANRFHTAMGVLMVDVDKFKEVNDAYGHHAGDKVLCELAKRISHAVRLTDTVARIGGDEFIVLLPDLHDAAEARSIAAKIVATASQPVLVDPLEVPVTVSVGVCTYPDAGSDVEKLLKNADAAMYGVKTHGRNGFEVYHSDAA